MDTRALRTLLFCSILLICASVSRPSGSGATSAVSLSDSLDAPPLANDGTIFQTTCHTSARTLEHVCNESDLCTLEQSLHRAPATGSDQLVGELRPLDKLRARVAGRVSSLVQRVEQPLATACPAAGRFLAPVLGDVAAGQCRPSEDPLVCVWMQLQQAAVSDWVCSCKPRWRVGWPGGCNQTAIHRQLFGHHRVEAGLNVCGQREAQSFSSWPDPI